MSQGLSCGSFPGIALCFWSSQNTPQHRTNYTVPQERVQALHRTAVVVANAPWNYCTLAASKGAPRGTGGAAPGGSALWSAGVFLSMIFFWKACKLDLFLRCLASRGNFCLFLQHIMASSVSSTKLNLYENRLFVALLRLAGVISFCRNTRPNQIKNMAHLPAEGGCRVVCRPKKGSRQHSKATTF